MDCAIRIASIQCCCSFDYVNPSDIVLQKTLLLNLSFGSKMESPTKLLSLYEDGKKTCNRDF